jgi:glutaredoxin
MSFRPRLIQSLLAACCFLWIFAAQAEIYKWVDKEGGVHYSDTPPEDETIAVTEFSGSPIKINDQGLMVQASAPTASVAKPQSASKPGITFSSLLADVKKYVLNLFPAQSAATHQVASSPENPVVISNDNMDIVLEQIAQEKQAQQKKVEALVQPQVEIFTTPWCGYCKKATAFLKINNISYQEYDVSSNSSAALRQQMLGGSGGVPFAVVNGEKIRGWNQQAYARALGL